MIVWRACDFDSQTKNERDTPNAAAMKFQSVLKIVRVVTTTILALAVVPIAELLSIILRRTNRVASKIANLILAPRLPSQQLSRKKRNVIWVIALLLWTCPLVLVGKYHSTRDYYLVNDWKHHVVAMTGLGLAIIATDMTIGLLSFLYTAWTMIRWKRFATSFDSKFKYYREIGGFSADCIRRERKTYTEIARWCLRAAELGHPRAMYDTSVAYMYGYGFKPDIAESLMWCQRAAEAGYDPAIQRLPTYKELSQSSTGHAQGTTSNLGEQH